jgi:hypothetical protein
MINGRGHRAEATVLIRTLRVDPIILFCAKLAGTKNEARQTTA